MNRTSSFLLITAFIFFVMGGLSSVGSYWLARKYFFPADRVRAEGILKFQGESDPSASANPPEGYFVESNAIERLYIVGLPKTSIGSFVRIKGTLSTICGADGYPCYPQVILIK